MRKLAIVNFIETFFSAALAISLPLYLLHRGINVEEIGLILAVSPLAFLVIRTLAAMVAEVLGTRVFFLATSVSEMLSSAIYMLAATPFLFGLGKFFEGTAYSFFWSVNRTQVFVREASKAVSLAKLLSIRMLAATVGIGAAGFLISISFDLLFQALIFGGLISLFISLFFWGGKGKLSRLEPRKMLNPGRKKAAFWEASSSIFFILSAFAILFSFLLPIHLKADLGMGYEEIGIIMMLFYLTIAVGSYSAIQMGMSEKRLTLFQDLTVPFIIMLPLAPQYILPMLMIVGFGFGVSFAMQEEMIVKEVEKSPYPSTDVALLHAPGRIGETLALAASGFVLTFFGSFPLFAASALLMALFIHLSRDVLK